MHVLFLLSVLSFLSPFNYSFLLLTRCDSDSSWVVNLLLCGIYAVSLNNFKTNLSIFLQFLAQIILMY